MTRAQILAVAVAGSLLVHTALLLTVPGRRVLLPARVERLVEVELAPPEETPAPPPPAPPEPAPEPEPPAPLAAGREEALADLLARGSARPGPPPAGPLPLRLPRREAAPPEVEPVPWDPPAPLEAPLPRRTRVPPSEVSAPGPGDAAHLAEALLEDLPPAPSGAPAAPLRRLDIEGPVGNERRVVREPRLPRVAIRNPADVRVKFWVSPRGEVVRAVPIQRGDPALDRAALEYIKGFRFDPLPGTDEEEQWGTIRVKFRLD